MATGWHAFVAGHPALDFVNTVADRGDPMRVRDRLAGADGAMAWLAAATVAGVVHLPAGVTVRRPTPAAMRDLARARENLHAIFAAQGTGCGWLFLDASPTRRRRWCSMSDCGNRAKATRYRRQRGGAASTPVPARPLAPSARG